MEQHKPKLYYRNCPTCKNTIYYKNNNGLRTAKWRNSDCRNCSALKKSVPKYKTNEEFLDELGIKQAWFIGLIATDGCIVDRKRINITQSGEDGLSKIKYIKNLLDTEANIITYKTIGKDSHFIQFTSLKLTNKLALHGVIPNKSLILEFSPIIAKSSENIIASYIRGCIEGDGCISIHKYKHTKDHLIITLAATEQFANVCSSVVPVKPKVNRIKYAKNLFDIRWNCSKAVDIFKWINFTDDLFIGSKILKGKNYVQSN